VGGQLKLTAKASAFGRINMNNILQDVRFALRLMLKSRVFTIIALTNLAIGIAVNTAIFSVVNAVLLQPLPYSNPERLVAVWDTQTNQTKKLTLPVSAPNFQDWQRDSDVFDGMSAYSFDYLSLTGQNEPERLFTAYVTPEFITTLGVKPVLGSSFSQEEGFGKRTDVVMVSYGLWTSRLGAQKGVIGQPLTLNGRSFTIIGVLPRDFQVPRQVSLGTVIMDNEVSLLLPLSFLAAIEPNTVNSRSRHFLHVVARLKSGVGAPQAGAEMTAIAGGLAERYPNANANFTTYIVPLHEQIVGRVRRALLILFGAVIAVLLIACANVANLLLARHAARQKEMAVRSALGADKGRLIRQLLTESVFLWLVGGVVGLLLALIGTRALLSLSPSDIPRLQDARVDAWVLGFTLLLTLVTGVLFALVPAIHAARANLNDVLKQGERSSSASPLNRRLRGALVMAELAMALVLLIGAGLLIKSFNKVLAVALGFDSNNVTTADVFLPSHKYSKASQYVNFHAELMERLRNTSGVQSAGTVSILPLKGNMAVTIDKEGAPAPPGQETYASQRIVSPGYFETMDISLRQGRFFNEMDDAKSQSVVIISEALAHKLWGNEEAIGKRINVNGGNSMSQIVGIVADVREGGAEAETTPEVYLPYRQQPWPVFSIVSRGPRGANMGSVLRGSVAAVDNDQAIAPPVTMEQILAEKLAERRLNLALLSVFGVVALILAIAGIYGVLSYSVAQRTHEVGLRMALGARPGNILKLVVGEGMIFALIGVTVGLAFALAFARLFSDLVYKISVADPLTFVAGAVLLCASAAIASYVPARRAMKTDPMQALRYD